MANRRFYRLRLFFEGLLIGIFTGVIVTALRILLDAADILRPLWFHNLSAEKIFLTLITLILVAIFLAHAINFLYVKYFIKNPVGKSRRLFL